MSILLYCLRNGHTLPWTHDLKGPWECSVWNFWQWLTSFPNRLVVPVPVGWITHSIETQKENLKQFQVGANWNVFFGRNMQAQTISAFKGCFPGCQELVSGDNTSFTERIWSFRGQGSLQTRKAVDLKKRCCHSQLRLWFFFQMLGSWFLAWPLLVRGFTQVCQMPSVSGLSGSNNTFTKCYFSEQVFQRKHVRPITYLCSACFPEERLKKN